MYKAENKKIVAQLKKLLLQDTTHHNPSKSFTPKPATVGRNFQTAATAHS
jgi:hypothetical protein